MAAEVNHEQHAPNEGRIFGPGKTMLHWESKEAIKSWKRRCRVMSRQNVCWASWL